MRRSFVYFLTFLIFPLFTIAETGTPVPQKKAPQKDKAISKAAEADSIIWHRYDQGMKLAKKENKKLFIDFTAKWCPYCRKMEATTFRDSTVIAVLNKYYIPVRVDGDSSDSLNVDGVATTEKAVARDFRVTGYPVFWFVTPGGERLVSLEGYRPPDYMLRVLDYLKDNLYKTISFADFLAAKARENDSTKTKSK